MITVPVSREVQRAIDETVIAHVAELDAALAPFGLTCNDIKRPDYERVVRADDTPM